MKLSGLQAKASRSVISRPMRCAAHDTQTQAPVLNRRQAAAAVLSVLAASTAAPAQAFLGIGEDPSKEYTQTTDKLLTKINATLALGPDDDKEKAVKELKTDMNNWTAKYRNSSLGGRPSFSNLYSVVNALAGHWNSFGADAPVPKKRMARISKEIEDATKFLARGR